MREKIIDTAIEEFTRNGLKFTMNDVAKALGISKKTIYTVFESKQDVLMAIADRYARDFTDMRQEIEADTELDTLEKLERLFCAIPTKYYNIGLSRIFELAQKYPKQYKYLMEAVGQGWALAEQYLGKGIREGNLFATILETGRYGDDPGNGNLLSGERYSLQERTDLRTGKRRDGTDYHERDKRSVKEVRVLEIKESVFADNDRQADNLRRELKEQGVFLMNLMSSPGSGKTTTLKGTIERLKDRFRIGVMEADIDSDVDAKAIAETGVKSIQLHTGGMCHLDAEMTRQGVEGLGVADVDLAILENVGNLVCPAEFDTGASKNVMILSVPEGHDKPLKYPLMFQICDAVLINKIDVLPYFDFDMERVKEYIQQRNPQAEVFPISAKTGEGMDAWTEWLAAQVTEWKK